MSWAVLDTPGSATPADAVKSVIVALADMTDEQFSRLLRTWMDEIREYTDHVIEATLDQVGIRDPAYVDQVKADVRRSVGAQPPPVFD